eukprot:5438190-Amphidinium_carterae.1
MPSAATFCDVELEGKGLAFSRSMVRKLSQPLNQLSWRYKADNGAPVVAYKLYQATGAKIHPATPTKMDEHMRALHTTQSPSENFARFEPATISLDSSRGEDSEENTHT